MMGSGHAKDPVLPWKKYCQVAPRWQCGMKGKGKVSSGMAQFVRQHDEKLNPHVSPPDVCREELVIPCKVREGGQASAADTKHQFWLPAASVPPYLLVFCSFLGLGYSGVGQFCMLVSTRAWWRTNHSWGHISAHSRGVNYSSVCSGHN